MERMAKDDSGLPPFSACPRESDRQKCTMVAYEPIHHGLRTSKRPWAVGTASKTPASRHRCARTSHLATTSPSAPTDLPAYPFLVRLLAERLLLLLYNDPSNSTLRRSAPSSTIGKSLWLSLFDIPLAPKLPVDLLFVDPRIHPTLLKMRYFLPRDQRHRMQTRTNNRRTVSVC
ncbi:hypothetical protein BD309DRAFT_89643 [Dichomitus squalens]|nr:hypothetical protein BD309DRAFT_89643 [Dichomitus squalens]